jgi:2-(1,2-epoxy-1,2-dihydrophenyl)acetyl-CoA isomerase
MIRYELGEDHVGRVTLDRPEAKNALSVQMRDDIIDVVRQARADDAVRALLITGVGDSFCAGMDLRASTVANAGAGGFDPRSTSEALRAGVQTFIRELWELDKPTVAAVNGTAVGPGAHLALACDFVLVHEATRFVWSFARWGLVVDAGGAYLLPRLVGLPRAKAMVLLGEGAVGAEAVELGLAYRSYPSPEELAGPSSCSTPRSRRRCRPRSTGRRRPRRWPPCRRRWPRAWPPSRRNGRRTSPTPRPDTRQDGGIR